MRIVVRFCENNSKKVEMEIDENSDVKNVKLMIEKLPETHEKYTKDYFHIFHRNIMLDNDRMVKFYAIESNDEMYVGKIEHYLEDDDEIVELFVIGDSLSFEYVVVKRYARISRLKQLISRIIPECVTVWSFSGFEMRDDLIITNILIMNGWYKFIIGCGEIKGSISNYLKIHDQYLVSSYAKKQKIICWFLDSKSEILQLKEKLIELKQSLEKNTIIPNLNKYLSNIPLSFIRSRYLFCMNTADEIWDICSDYWSTMIGQQSIIRFIRVIFRVELNAELLIYSNIFSNLENVIDSILSYIDDNRSILTNKISESMAKLVHKYESMMKLESSICQENNDLIPSKYIDCINSISDEIVNDIKTKFIIGSDDSSNCKEFLNYVKYEEKVYDFIDEIFLNH